MMAENSVVLARRTAFSESVLLWLVMRNDMSAPAIVLYRSASAPDQSLIAEREAIGVLTLGRNSAVVLVGTLAIFTS